MCKKFIFFVLAFGAVYPSIGQQAPVLQVKNLSCENRNNPVNIDREDIYLSWQLVSTQRNVIQTAYQIMVDEDPANLRASKGGAWNTEKITSAQSVQVAYRGNKLKPTSTYYWQVRVWDNKGNVSHWSKPALWRMGLLEVADWKQARWIAYDTLPHAEIVVPAIHGLGDTINWTGKDVLPIFRKNFRITKRVKQAIAYISGLGHFELSINGEKTGNHFLDPGWTKYDKQAQYVTFDVTKQVVQGKNAIGVMLGNGFYYVPPERYRKITGFYGYPKLICRLLLQYADGSSEDIVSDGSWKTAAGPITFSSIYGGEDYNANLEQNGWNKPAFNDAAWKNVILTNGPLHLAAQSQEPIKIFESFPAKTINQPKPNIWVYDLGQNASAIPEIIVTGQKNATVKLTPAELLNPDGTVNQSASGEPSFFQYTLSGKGSEHWQPNFTYYGFRYIQVEGAVPPGKPNPTNLPIIQQLKSRHIRNSAARVGEFTCSNKLFNRTDTLIDWAIKSNMMSVFTDCPHREKLGWLEQDHLMGSSVSYNYDIAALAEKTTQDMIFSQDSSGLVPDIAPEYVQFADGFRDSPEWGSSSIIVPWYTYKWYGRIGILKDAYPMMQRYADYLDSKADNNILMHGLGDWFDIGPKKPGESQLTPKGVTATAIYYYDLSILSQIAALLNKPSDAAMYTRRATDVKRSFNQKFFDSAKMQYATGSQTANAIAVYMGLASNENKKAIVDNLVAGIRENKNRLTAGDIGYRYVLRVLEENERSDVIFDMNCRSDVPGYGWQLEHGATALTESWQAYGFVSNNHFMLGHLMEWLYSGLAGIRMKEHAVAFNDIEIHPSLVGDLRFAKASYQSVYGTIVSAWKKNGSSITLTVQIPPNAKATVSVPNPSEKQVFENGKPVATAADIKFVHHETGYSIYQMGSGTYSFEIK